MPGATILSTVDAVVAATAAAAAASAASAASAAAAAAGVGVCCRLYPYVRPLPNNHRPQVVGRTRAAASNTSNHATVVSFARRLKNLKQCNVLRN